MPADSQLCVVERFVDIYSFLPNYRDVKPVNPGFQRSFQAGDAPISRRDEQKTFCDETPTTTTAVSTSGVYSAPETSIGVSFLYFGSATE